MSFETVEIAELTDALAEQAAALMRAAFGHSPAMSAANIRRSSRSPHPTVPTRYFAAISRGRMIGFNAFIVTPVRRGGGKAVAYQSCWSATHPDFQGKGVWVAIMNFARDSLRSSGVYIFGIPNPSSHPIMVRKLGYREVPVLSTLIPAFPAVLSHWVDRKGMKLPTGYVPEERAIAQNKKLGDHLIQMGDDAAFAWGKVQKSRWKRLPVSFLSVGGIELATDGQSLSRVMESLMATPAQFLHVVISSSHELACAFRRLRQLSGVRPFVVLDLQTAQNDPLNVMYGITDVF